MIQRILDKPWGVIDEAHRLLVLPYVRLLFAANRVRYGRAWRVFGAPIIQRHRGSRIVIGDRLDLRSWYSTNPLAPNHPVVLATRTAAAVIRIGHECGFTGATVVSASSVQIGNRVFVGANAVITDTDFHPLLPSERQRDPYAGKTAPIRIEDDVFIGMNSLILKGVRIGCGSVVGAGSVVSRDVPPGVVVAGNPAHVVRQVEGRPC